MFKSSRQDKHIFQNITPEQQSNVSHWEEPFSKAQETICSFFVVKMKKESPAWVLQEFERLFFIQTGTIPLEVRQALAKIVRFNQEQIFRSTLKRSCYILINNWSAARDYQPIHILIELFSKTSESQNISSPAKQRLNQWLTNFSKSQDYQELKSFVSRYNNRDKHRWSNHYASYLLTVQSLDSKIPRDQREAAKVVSKELKEQFKFDLAMYTARASVTSSSIKKYQNPTVLGNNVLRLIKKILAKHGTYSYTDIANIFLGQIEGLSYKKFKRSLVKYLLFSLEKDELLEMLEINLSNCIESLYEDYNKIVFDRNLLLRTCNRVIEYLTTQNKGEPSRAFTSLLIQGKSFNLVILLLKIVLLCRDSYVHLETSIAYLIHYYEDEPVTNCKWLISFLETLKVTLTIYVENVRYNLVSLKANQPKMQMGDDINSCRIFSQIKFEQEQETVQKSDDSSKLKRRRAALV